MTVERHSHSYNLDILLNSYERICIIENFRKLNTLNQILALIMI